MRKIDIYTDGSSLGNPGPGGWGLVVVEGDKIIHEQGGYDKNTTNNRMELQAVIETLKYLFARQDLAEKFEISIYADSAYVLGGVTSWMENWKRNGWKTANKKPVLNQDFWLVLDDLISNFKGNIFWKKIKGHAGHVYNERADEIATTCANKQKNHRL